MSMSWSDYQMKYVKDRLGQDYYVNGGGKIYNDDFDEQTHAMSIIYATVRWACDKLFG